MRVINRYQVPTGDILVVEGEHGPLEMLSIGDYGKDVNVKADFLGLTRDPEPVKHAAMLPLEEKWVVTISTQYGCSMRCEFCDVPKVGRGLNATTGDMLNQVETAIKLHPEVKTTKRLNIHFARMGEPTFNPGVIGAAWSLWKFVPKDLLNIHPVVSTMMPRQNHWLRAFIHSWMTIKNTLYHGNAGLQLSINSTDESERYRMFSGNACTLEEIHAVMDGVVPEGRKITLNFALAGYTIDQDVLLQYFNPEHYICKLTPMHKTAACIASGVKTDGDYTTYEPYQETEKRLKRAGYDVLVFIASREEDEGRITCGNAVLSGTRPFDL